MERITVAGGDAEGMADENRVGPIKKEHEDRD